LGGNGGKDGGENGVRRVIECQHPALKENIVKKPLPLLDEHNHYITCGMSGLTSDELTRME
jgi:hypothetical protein